MVAHICFTADDAVTPPLGWTNIRTDHTTANTDRSSYLGWKIADAADVLAGTFVFTGDISATNVGAISAWTGFNVSNPINANNGQVNAADNISPEITPSVASCMICLFVMAVNDVAVSAYAVTTSNPASWTEAYDLEYVSGADRTAAMGYAIRPETTGTGNGTWTMTSENNIGQLIAIEPAGGGGAATTDRLCALGVGKNA